MFANFGLKKILNGKMNITKKRFFGEYINSHLSLFGATYLWFEASPQGWKFVRASKIKLKFFKARLIGQHFPRLEKFNCALKYPHKPSLKF